MKQFIALIIVLILVIGGVIGYSVVKGNNDFYNSAPSIGATEAVTDTDKLTYYYYYGEDCPHCINIKADVADFYDSLDTSAADFYIIDAFSDENSIAFDSSGLIDFSTASEQDVIAYESSLPYLTIGGTPTLYVVENGQVIGYYVGETQIPAYFDSLN